MDTKPFVGLFEVAALEMLKRAPRLVVFVPGNVDLAVLANNGAVTFDKHRRVEAVLQPIGTWFGEFGITERKPDAQALRFIEQRLCRRTWHRCLVVVVVSRQILGVPPRKERRQCQFGKHDQFTVTADRLMKHGDQAFDDRLARVVFLDWPELRSSDGDVTTHVEASVCVEE